MKIGLTVDSKAYGGIEAHIIELANALHQQGINVTVIRLNHYTVMHPLADKCARLNIPYIELDGNVLQYYRYISKHNFSLIHSHGYKANILNKIGKLFCSYRAVCTFHSGDQGRGKLFLYDATDRYTAWFSAMYTITSSTSRKTVLSLLATKTDNSDSYNPRTFILPTSGRTIKPFLSTEKNSLNKGSPGSSIFI
jgi:glycosyltransferase involved in cell wall biosynthesis